MAFARFVSSSTRPSGRSVRTALLWLVAASMLPLAVVTPLVAWQLWQAQREAAEQGLRDTAVALSLAVDRDVAAVQGQLDALAASRLIDERRWAELHAFQRALAAKRPGAVLALVADDGQVLVQSNFEFGAALHNLWALEDKQRNTEWQGQTLPLSSQGLSRAVFAGGEAVVSGLYIAVASRQPVVATSVPVKRDGVVRYALIYSFPTASLEHFFGAPDAIQRQLLLLDASGVVIARSAAAPQPVGSRFMVAPPEAPELLSAASRSALTGWTVRVSEPVATVLAPTRRAVLTWGLLFALALAAAATAAILLARRLARPLAALAEHGGLSAAGIGASGIREVDLLSERLRRAAQTEQERRAELARRIAAEQHARAAAESERRVREREEELLVALQAGQMGTWRYDPAAGRVRCDARQRELWELPVGDEDLDVDELRARLHPDDLACSWFSGHYDLEEHGAGQRLEFRVRGGDGWRWLASHGVPLYDDDGTVLGLIGVDYDSTERKRSEAALARFAFVVDSVDDAIVALDGDGRVQTWNPAAERIYQWTAAEAVGRSLAALVEDARHPQLDGLLAAVRDGTQVRDVEVTQRRRDGTTLHVALTLAQLRVGGDITGLTATMRDITARKQYEQTLRGHLAELEAADRRKDHFLAMLGHELRNPLAPIANGARLLRQGGGDAALAARVGAVIERQAEHLSRLLDDLLDVARITEGRIVLKRERVELMPLVQQALEATRGLIESRGHRLQLRPPAGPVLLHADGARIVQILTNLLSNAARYTAEQGRIELTVERLERSVRIRVCDNGIGIAAADLPGIFTAFAAAPPQARERAHGGLGIGLALVKRLTELHQGTVGVDSEGPGRGTQITLMLPLAGAIEPVAAAAPAPAAAQPPGLSCLVVDDNVDAADSLVLLLEALGQRASGCHDGPSALEQARQDWPQLAILDIALPGMDGYALAAQLRVEAAGRPLFLAALTGYGQPADAARAEAAGFDIHLVKPLSTEALQRLLAAAAVRHGLPEKNRGQTPIFEK